MATRCIAPTILPARRDQRPFRRASQRSWAASERSMRSITPNSSRRWSDTSRSSARRPAMASSSSVVGERRQVGEHAVEALEVGRPLAVLLGRHLQREAARRRVPRGPESARICGQLVDELLERPAARAAPHLGLEDVDAGLGEPAHVRHLGLELEALGVLRPQLLDRARSRSSRYSGSRTRALRSCASAMPTSRSRSLTCSPLVVLTVPSDLRRSGHVATRCRRTGCFGSTARRFERRVRIGACCRWGRRAGSRSGGAARWRCRSCR